MTALPFEGKLTPQDANLVRKAMAMFRQDYRYAEAVLHAAHIRRRSLEKKTPDED